MRIVVSAKGMLTCRKLWAWIALSPPWRTLTVVTPVDVLTGARPLFSAVLASRLKQNSLGLTFVLLPTRVVMFRIIGSTVVIQGTPLTKVDSFIDVVISSRQRRNGLLLVVERNSRVVVLTMFVSSIFLSRTKRSKSSSRALQLSVWNALVKGPREWSC